MRAALLLLFIASSTAQRSNNFVQRATTDMSTKVLNNVIAQNPGENVAFAPFSLVIGLGMLYEGLGGTTRRNVGAALGFPSQEALFRDGFSRSIPGKNDTETTAYANSVIVEDTASVKGEFGTTMANIFKANPFRHDFSGRPKVAIRSVNMWVQKHSNGKIKQLMPPGSITSNTKVVLVNVIHFKSDWKQKFDNVFPGEFTLADGTTKEVDTMYGNMKNVGYQRLANGAEMARLDFVDGDHAMVLVIPSKESNIQDQIVTLDDNALNLISNPDQMPTSEAVVQIPKFQIDQRLRLKEIFMETYPGISDIFSPRGDFSRMAENTDGFAVDEIHHKAVVEVNENGVEATGATGIAIVLKSGFFPETEVIADRPFAYYIVDKRRQHILFAGILNDPSSS